MDNIDERILHILKTVAIENKHYDDMSTWCGFCDGEENYGAKFDGIAHKPGCAMLLARIVLKEMGMPLYGYQVSYEMPRWASKKKIESWFPVTQYHEVFDERDLRKEYPESKGEPVYHVPYQRNVKIELVEEL